MTYQVGTRTGWLARLWVLRAALLAAAILCGCSSTASPATAQGSSGSGSRESFQQCLKQHGVTAPTGRPGSGTPGQPPSGNSGAFQKAIQACGRLDPRRGASGGGFGGGFGGPPNLAGLFSCLKKHGVTVSGSGFAALRNLNRGDPEVQKALSACRAQFGPGNGGNGGPPPGGPPAGSPAAA